MKFLSRRIFLNKALIATASVPLLSNGFLFGENAERKEISDLVSNHLQTWKKAVLEANKGMKPLSLAFFGDSNTEMNSYVSSLRMLLQGCYGDKGFGYQSFGQHIQTVPGAALVTKTGDWKELDFAIDPALPAPPEPWFAFDGLWVNSKVFGDKIETKIAYPSETTIYFQTGKEFGSFQLTANNFNEIIPCHGEEDGISSVKVKGDAFQIIVKDKNISLFGFNTVRMGLKGGALVHQLGNGFGMAHHFAAIQEVSLSKLFDDIKPDLITVMLGTNDMNNGWYPEDYRVELEKLVIKLKKNAGDTSILLISCPSGMFDRMKFAGEYDLIVKEVANKHNVNFWSLYAEIGEKWKYWNQLGLMEYTLHYLPANGLKVAMKLLEAVDFKVLDNRNCPVWSQPSLLLPVGTEPVGYGSKEDWPKRPTSH